MGAGALRFRATSVQRGMIVDSLRAAVPGVDVLQVVLTRPGSLDRAAFESCWEVAASRHDSLRSTFHWNGVQGVDQQVHVTLSPPVVWVDLVPDRSARDQVDAFLRADRVRRFDLCRRPLLRVAVLSGRSPEQTIVVTFHHAIVDGRSLVVLLGEVFAQHDARLGGLALERPAVPSFQAYVNWWEQQDQSSARAFWKTYLSDLPAGRPLAGRLGEPVGDQSDPVTLEASLTSVESADVRAGAAAVGVPTSALVHAAWGLVMARHAGVDDVVFAVTRSCRWDSVEGAQHMVGPLINTVPLRLRIDPDQSVAQLLVDARARALENRQHQVAPLAEVLGWAGQPADASRIESLVVVERATLQARLHQTHAELREVRIKTLRQLSFPLALYVFDEPQIRLDLMFDQCRFDRSAAEEVLAQFRHVLVALGCGREASVGEIGLEQPDVPKALRMDHDLSFSYPRDATIPALFATQVRARPGAPALTADGTTWTYAELDRRSDRLARVLRHHGVATEHVVAVALPRSADLIVTLLAVVKAGGAYLPVDPDSPPSRTSALLTEAHVSVVVTTRAGSANLPPVDARTLRLDDPHVARELARPDHPADAVAVGAHPLSAAYINHTSGSTGTPKGVAVPHRAVVRLVHEPNFATLGPGEVLLHLAPVAFDATTLEVWGALLTGARLVVAPPGPLDLAELAAVIRHGAISTLWLTAGLFSQLVELDVDALAGVRQVIAGGDILPPDSVRAVLRARPGQPLINGYGPTENTTFTTCHRMVDPDDVPDRVPIGRPVQQTCVYVLDGDLAPLPIGVTGELYTGGDGLARGYVARPGQTAERFVPDPFSAEPGARLYRTGDLVRWRADGVLEFVGRLDDQVKIRGFRVEPREVEAVLRKHAGVHEAVVVARGDGLARHLVAYVSPHHDDHGTTLRPRAVREHAQRCLPSYLVPSSVVVLERLPLGSNGKVDRAALSDAEPLRTGAAPGPRTPTERRLATLWAELVPTGPVGVDDDFFAVGGNSLGAIRLVFRIEEVFAVALSVRQFYQASTFAGCARAIDDALALRDSRERGDAAAVITRRDRSAFRAGSPSAATATSARCGQVRPQGHLIRLTDEWALWETVCLRSAGLPIDLVERLADPAIAALADRSNAAPEEQSAYLAEFTAATRRLTYALIAAGGDRRLREAVAWQNRHALGTGIDSLLRHDPEAVNRNKRHRQHEALLGSYLQRYCAKNDTIGFFGPVGWSRLVESGPAVSVRHGDSELAARTVHLEGWAVTGLLRPFAADLLPALKPRRLPHVDVVDGMLRVPLAQAVPLSPTEQAVIAACDGRRTAHEIAESVARSAGVGDTQAVYDVMTALAASRRIAWRLEVPPDDVHGERTARALLAAAPPSPVRSAALAALDELGAGRDALAAAAGDADAVAGAVADLEQVFVRHTGAPPSRRAGELYAGRTIAYEECLLGASVEFGASLLDGIRDALGAVLTGARWFTAASAALYSRLLRGVFDARVRVTGVTGVMSMPFAELWLLATDMLFDPPDELVRPLTRALAQRWAAVLQLPPSSERRVQLASAGLVGRARTTFEVARPGWPAAVHHSPDLMLLAKDDAAAQRGDVDWVLGELHPGINTQRYEAVVARHSAPDSLRAAMAADVTGPAVWTASSAEPGGVPARQSNRLASPDDWWLVFAHDAFGVDPDRALRPGELDVVDVGGRLRVRSRDGRIDLGLMEVLGDVIAGAMIQHFRVVPRGGTHTPRVCIDRLVVSRESWSFQAAELSFAYTKDEARRYQEARAWATRHDVPRRLFLRATGEAKPIYVDLASIVSVDLMSRAVRRAARTAGPAASIAVTEMLPEPEQLWLTDAAGRRHTAELRVVAVDQRERG